MSWSTGYDAQWKRDIGYGVPAICDHPGCKKKIWRRRSKPLLRNFSKISVLKKVQTKPLRIAQSEVIGE